MAKKKKTSKKQQKVSPENPPISFLQNLEKPTYIIAFFILLFVVLALLYQPMVFKGEEPSGSDVISGVGQAKQVKMWEEKTGHRPLWNPYMFGGMPRYPRFQPVAWSIDTLLNHLDFLGDWRLWFFMAGALGMFLLIKYLGFSAALGMFGALSFVLMPHFQALIMVGHFAKFRALMWMPWVLLTALMLVKQRTLLSALLFGFALAIQFRTQHYQIMFYTLLIVLFMVVPPLYRLIKEKAWPVFGKAVGYALLAFALMLLISAQNLFSIKEYTPYSTRGGHAISIEKTGETQQEKKGVGFDYATNWSYSVSELWNLIIPKFHGGTSGETYTGNAVPQWKNKQLPTYWGSMPFTQSYEYLGILVAFLALIGIFFNWKRWEVKSLTFITILALLMSLGKHFAPLYRLFFYYMPYFDKFRVPMMILTVVMFSAVLLAVFGIRFLMTMDFSNKDERKKLYIIGGILTGLLIIPLIFGSSFSLSHLNETQRYGQEAVNMLKKVRLEMLRNSALQSLLYLILGFFAVFAVQKTWLRREFLPLTFIIIVFMDLVILDHHAIDDNFLNPDVAENQQYRLTGFDQILLKDNSLYRVLPLGRLFQDTRWSYRYQSIGGYSAAKLQTIQEIVDNNLYQSVDGTLPLNWNVADLLNAKYLISPQPMNSPRLKELYANSNQKMYLYLNKSVLPRAFFVSNYQVISNGEERLKMLNNPRFDPARTAILESKPEKAVEAPDSTQINITTYQPDKIVLDVFTDKSALMVLSEMYYPKGWSAILDGKEKLKIFKTDHLIRSVIVPAGKHTIQFSFHPESYYAGVRISSISLMIVYLAIAILLLMKYRYLFFGKK